MSNDYAVTFKIDREGIAMDIRHWHVMTHENPNSRQEKVLI